MNKTKTKPLNDKNEAQTQGEEFQTPSNQVLIISAKSRQSKKTT